MASPDFSLLFTGQFAKDGRGEIDPVTRCPLYDCWGLVMAAHRLLGVEIPDMGKGRAPEEAHAVWEREIAIPGRWILVPKPQAPCVVVLRTTPGASWACSHFGTYVGGGEFVHIMRATRVMTDEVEIWRRKIQEFRVWGGGR